MFDYSMPMWGEGELDALDFDADGMSVPHTNGHVANGKL